MGFCQVGVECVMLEVSAITNDPYQVHEVYLPNGEPLGLTLKFHEQQYAWIIEEMTYKDYVFHGIKIVDSMNLLFQFSSRLPFGLACYSTNKIGPSFIDDFAEKISTLYILTQEECDQIKSFFTGN